MSIFTPDRNLSNLTPEMEERVKAFLQECQDEGVPVFVTEGMRTKARQLYLYAGGRRISKDFEKRYLGYDDPDIESRPSASQVTWTLQSNHFNGNAVDIAFRGDNLYPDFSTYAGKRTWDKVWDIAEKHGLKSLYREKGGSDLAHLDLDPNWTPSKHWSDGYQQVLIDEGIMTQWKDPDKPRPWGEVCKVTVLSNPDLKKKYEKLKK